MKQGVEERAVSCYLRWVSPFKWFMVCVLFPVAVASAFEFERVDVEGLSHNSVYAILQDRQGFLWLGTADGLNRFDGREVVVLRDDE